MRCCYYNYLHICKNLIYFNNHNFTTLKSPFLKILVVISKQEVENPTFGFVSLKRGCIYLVQNSKGL